MSTEKTFKTKTGYCHVLPDRVVLSRDGVAGGLAKVAVGSNINRILVLYSIISGLLLFGSVSLFLKGQTAQPLFFGLIGLYLAFAVIDSLNNSAAAVIERSSIKSVKFRKSIPFLTRSHFVILFEDEQGKLKKRLILLPGSMSEGAHETETAVRIMKEEKLL